MAALHILQLSSIQNSVSFLIFLLFINFDLICGRLHGLISASLDLNVAVLFKGRFTYTPNPNRNRTETVTATELHRFVFGRPFEYEPNPWTKSQKMPV